MTKAIWINLDQITVEYENYEFSKAGKNSCNTNLNALSREKAGGTIYSLLLIVFIRAGWQRFIKSRLLCLLKYDVTMNEDLYALLLYGSVSQGLGTTKFTNLIGWIFKNLRWLWTACTEFFKLCQKLHLILLIKTLYNDKKKFHRAVFEI